MNAIKKRILPRVEKLEQLALMATLAPAIPIATVHAASIGSASTGLGNIGSVNVNDVVALHTDASGGFLEQYISQLEVLYGKQTNVKKFASAVIADHQVANYDLETTAYRVGVTIPIGIALPTDIQNAQTVLNAVKHGNVDKTYLNVMQTINGQDIANDQSTQSSPSSNPAVTLYASEALSYDQNHLAGAQGLSKSYKNVYSPSIPTGSLTPPPTTITPAPAADAQALQTDASGNALEVFISNIELLAGKRTDAQQYAQAVVADHQVTVHTLLTTGAAAAVTIPSGITVASDIKDAQTVLNAYRHGNLDKTYLQVMQRINAMDVQADQQLTNTTQVPVVALYASETQGFDQIHLAGANQLLSIKNGSLYSPTLGG